MTGVLATTCGAMGRKGTPCRRPAGWGTGHPGFGTCKLHLGSSARHGRAAARDEAMQFARGALGQELDMDPLQGVLVAVKLSYGVVDWWRHKLAAAGENTIDLQDGYSKSLTDYTRICDIAIKAGVAERQIKVMERAAEQLSLLFEELVAAAKLTREQRELALEAWVRGLARLETQTVDSTGVELAA